jgi:hypothetical protein
VRVRLVLFLTWMSIGLAGVTARPDLTVDAGGDRSIRFAQVLDEHHPGTIPLIGTAEGGVSFLWAVLSDGGTGARIENPHSLTARLVVIRCGRVDVGLIASDGKKLKMARAIIDVRDGTSKPL